jgi:proteic killer suppression protein
LIKSWKHKYLRDFFELGNTKGVQAKHIKRLQVQLALLNSAVRPKDMNLPGYHFHALQGNMKGLYSITVNANWRMTFGFEGTNAILVNYEDYH